uniref:BTB domain-containing protein n=1 Tax=Triticum urartu TaxID=4572 RepID=A0A8R7QHQ6_TRIUA
MAEGEAPTGLVTGPGEEKTEAEVDAGFEFAFNNKAFSDRVLRIEVVGTTRKRHRYKAKDNDGEGIDSSCVVMGTSVLRVKTIHVSSVILAARSSFFFKLFSNGAKKSGQRQSKIRIADSEGNAFMELLRFMYNGKLRPTTESSLLVDILMAADKFDVVSCIKLCTQRLIGQPMTLECAVRCLDLPCSISMAADLSEAAKKFLSERYEKFLLTKFQDELMTIPLTGIVAILSRNHPGVASEESVYDFVLRWAHLQYPNSEERHKILSSSLLPLVTLGRIMTIAILTDQSSCVINFSIKHEHCRGLFPSRSIRSPPFYCAGQGFFLSALAKTEPFNFFGLLIKKLEGNGPLRGTIDYEMEVTARRSSEFASISRRTTTTDIRQAFGCRIPWSEISADDSPFFVDDNLHLRVRIKITPQP